MSEGSEDVTSTGSPMAMDRFKRFPLVGHIVDGHHEQLLQDILEILQATRCANQPKAGKPALFESEGWKVAFHEVYDTLGPECSLPISNRYSRFCDRMVDMWKRIERAVAKGKRDKSEAVTALALEQLETFREATMHARLVNDKYSVVDSEDASLYSDALQQKDYPSTYQDRHATSSTGIYGTTLDVQRKAAPVQEMLSPAEIALVVEEEQMRLSKLRPAVFATRSSYFPAPQNGSVRPATRRLRPPVAAWNSNTSLFLTLDPPLRVLNRLARGFLLSQGMTNTLQFLEAKVSETAVQLMIWSRAWQAQPLSPALAARFVQGWKDRVILKLRQQATTGIEIETARPWVDRIAPAADPTLTFIYPLLKEYGTHLGRSHDNERPLPKNVD